MLHIRQLDKEGISNLVNEFVEKVFAINSSKEISPFNMCLRTCYPLHLHLKNNYVENSIIKGQCKNIPHYWINLEGEVETIIDPTIRQFDFARNFPFVYIGKKTSIFEEDISYKFTDKDAIGLLQDFIVNHTNKSFPDYATKPKHLINLDEQRIVMLKAGLIISNEIEKKYENNSNISLLHQAYFKILKEIINKYTDEATKIGFSNNQEYFNLLLWLSRV